MPQKWRAIAKARHLYKYRSMSVDDQSSVDKMRSLIVNEEIWCAAASSFNDAMEMDFDIKLPDSKIAIQKSVQKNRRMFDGLEMSPAKRILFKQKAFRNIKSLNPEAEKAFREDIDKDLGLYCMSSDPKSHLMWGHYGDGGRGLCVQFGTYIDPIFMLADEVIYTNERVAVPFFVDNDDRPKAYLYKSDHWNYEKEWRIAVLGHLGVLRLAKNSITGVIFGPKASQAVISAVKSMGDERIAKGFNPLRLYRAVIVGKSYKILSL